MILLILIVLVGMLGVYAYLRKRRQSIQLPRLHATALVLVAFAVQTVVFYGPAKKMPLFDTLATFLLVGSQALLLIFIWRNRHWPGLCILGFGLLLNLLVMSANGGLMPITPQTLKALTTENHSFLVGTHLPESKDIVLALAETKLWWLSDRFVSPSIFSYQAAYSLGDVLIALGAITMMGSIGKSGQDREIS